VLKCGAGQRFHRRHAERVVDQDVHLAVGIHGGLDEAIHLAVVGDVGTHRDRRVSSFVDLLGDFL
jgi:hypothetical protein